MHKFRNQLFLISGLIWLLTFSGCQKWVDDTDQPLQVDESEVFSTEKGFREALNGIYLQMGAETLYGKEMTFGILSLAGRNYDSVSVKKSGNLYYKAATLDLTSSELKAYSASVWTKIYIAIANVNHILNNVEERKSMFTGNNYQTFKGEAMALRAYLHFDLLRMFSSTVAEDRGIPYCTTLSYQTEVAQNVAVTANKCIADLEVADSLLASEDLTTSQLTKWAVKGLLARIYLYRGDKTNANKYAQEVIASNKFALTVGTNADLLFTKESLFKLYVYSNNFYASVKAFFGAPALNGLAVSSQNALYGTGSTDYRRSFIDATTGLATGVPLFPKKLNASSANIFPMVRLSELYYIAAECTDDLTQALTYINTVRGARNLAPLAAQDMVNEEMRSLQLQLEYRKEFLAEGQVFFYFKRVGLPFTALPFYPTESPVVGRSNVAVSADATYVFSRPE
ncbi:RagB/SusD family nutrient uptake outer membrane protein [Sphingobacterium multivorum]|nr:RagB/SusD family nutrient uptake outer membrane protein [Sphingobacterium multivorum]QQT31908.1 RagB/SusD family nutrient uptake outer membrane protein [Sphingobacterium multivorum]